MTVGVQGERLRRAAMLALPGLLAGGRLDFCLERSQLTGAERASLQWLLSGTLRESQHLQETLRRYLRSGRQDPQVLALLQLALFELRHGHRPSFAVVDDWVNASLLLHKPWAKGLVNAVLRRYLREEPEVAAPDWAASHPDWLLQRLQQAYPQQWPAIVQANLQEPPLWLRVNPKRVAAASYQRLLQEQGIAANTFPDLPDALLLPKSIPVRDLPGWEEGWVTVQDGAAQFAAELLAPQPGERILDACAAPGGKTAHLLARGARDLLALDRSAPRLARMGDALQRLREQPRILHADAAKPEEYWDGIPFDAILLDAPCSASGIVRRHPDILHRQPDLRTLTQEQAQLLEVLWPLLRPGGRLLYCTCSVLPEENIEQIRSFLARHEDALLVADPRCRQRLPGEDGMDGFYYALMRKAEDLGR